MSLTLLQAWQSAKTRLETAGLAGPVIDARLLVEAAAEATRADIVTDPYRALTPEQEERLADYLARRERRQPVSHILGRKGFWKIMLSVTPDVLTPRPDTEVIVDYVLKKFPDEAAAFQILDLGVGSGAIVLSIREEPYVEAALSVGTPTPKILWRHILPNTIAPLIVQATFIAGSAILLEAILSFLGVGMSPETPTWGNIIAEARQVFQIYPHGILFPGIALVTPLFQLFGDLGWFGTYRALIIPNISFALPLTIYTLVSFLRDLPWELEEAARVDGATPGQAFRLVLLPLAAPALFTTAILAFITTWNEFMLARQLSTTATEPVTVAIARFSGPSAFEFPYTSIMAAGALVTIPLIIMVLVFQRRIVSGLTSGSLK